MTTPPAAHVPVIAGVALEVTDPSVGVAMEGAGSMHMLVGAPEQRKPIVQVPGEPAATGVNTHAPAAEQVSVVQAFPSLQLASLVHATQTFEPSEPGTQKGVAAAQPRSVPSVEVSRQGSQTGEPAPVVRQCGADAEQPESVPVSELSEQRTMVKLRAGVVALVLPAMVCLAVIA